MKFYQKYLIAGLTITFGTSLFIPSALATTVGTDVRAALIILDKEQLLTKI